MNSHDVNRLIREALNNAADLLNERAKQVVIPGASPDYVSGKVDGYESAACVVAELADSLS